MESIRVYVSTEPTPLPRGEAVSAVRMQSTPHIVDTTGGYKLVQKC